VSCYLHVKDDRSSSISTLQHRSTECYHPYSIRVHGCDLHIIRGRVCLPDVIRAQINCFSHDGVRLIDAPPRLYNQIIKQRLLSRSLSSDENNAEFIRLLALGRVTGVLDNYKHEREWTSQRSNSNTRNGLITIWSRKNGVCHQASVKLYLMLTRIIAWMQGIRYAN
jgi:hypothetical protein